jgi:hypothetical protein
MEYILPFTKYSGRRKPRGLMRANDQAVTIKGSRTVNAPESLNPSGRLQVRDPAGKTWGTGK